MHPYLPWEKWSSPAGDVASLAGDAHLSRRSRIFHGRWAHHTQMRVYLPWEMSKSLRGDAGTSPICGICDTTLRIDPILWKELPKKIYFCQENCSGSACPRNWYEIVSVLYFWRLYLFLVLTFGQQTFDFLYPFLISISFSNRLRANVWTAIESLTESIWEHVEFSLCLILDYLPCSRILIICYEFWFLYTFVHLHMLMSILFKPMRQWLAI
jgi:hypothetical protein